MILYGLKACDTCRKARKELPGADFVDVREDGMTDDLRRAALDRFGTELLNTRSTTWRGLSDAERAAPPEELLAAHPALMKRPLIVAGDDMYLGWTPQVRQALGAD